MEMPMEIPHTVRVSAKAGRISIRVNVEAKVELVLPRRGSMEAAERFFASRRRWIERTVEKQKERIRMRTSIDFRDGASIPFLGDNLMVRVVIDIKEHVRLIDTELLVHAKALEHVKDLIETWYREQAKIFFMDEIEHYAAILKVRYGRITVKDQASLWGSCSKQGNLNFSWRLLLAPIDVARYVVAHECAHLIHMNHSAKFWNVVEKLCPEYPAHVQWLKQNGLSLK